MADNLNREQQKNIQSFKDAYAKAQAAGDKAGMEAAHAGAEGIRNQAGFSGGANGSEYIPMNNSGGAENNKKNFGGGMTADQMQNWVQGYDKANTGNVVPLGGPSWAYGTTDWTNGYSAAMNLRSKANKIRQQMEANSKAWASADQAGKDYLHQQNLELAEILRKNNGGARSEFNEQTGQWETDNGNLGYGTIRPWRDADRDYYKNMWGMTDDQFDEYANDSSRYHNFVDHNAIRNLTDESPGFTGEYAQFVNGPYASMLNGGAGSVSPHYYMDTIGDGFGTPLRVIRDANGNIIKQAPDLKNNNGITDYTRQHAAYAQDGVLMPNTLNRGQNSLENAYVMEAQGQHVPYGGPVSGVMRGPTPAPGQEGFSWDALTEDQIHRTYGDGGNDPAPPWLLNQYAGVGVPNGSGGSIGGGGGGFSGSYSSSSGGGSDLRPMINQMYDSSLNGQLAVIDKAYQEAMGLLNTQDQEQAAAYQEQKRQAAGQADLQAHNFRETANAQGLGSGSYGQAALAYSNQIQSDLNALNQAEAEAKRALEAKRAMIGQQKQLEIMQAHAENDAAKLQMLYKESVRLDQAFRQEAMMNAQRADRRRSELMNMLMKMSGGTGGGRSGGRGGGYGGSSGSSTVSDDDDLTTPYAGPTSAQRQFFNDTMAQMQQMYAQGRYKEATDMAIANENRFTADQQNEIAGLIDRWNDRARM